MTNNEITLVGIDYLRVKLQSKRKRVSLRYDYYDQKKIAQSMLISAPQSIARFMPPFGWCAKAVDELVDRVSFSHFDDDSDVYGLNELYGMNNGDVLFDSAILSAAIASCCFIYISMANDGVQMQVIDGANATGVIDPLTGMLKEGYAILDVDPITKAIKEEAYFTPDYTEFYRDGESIHTELNPAPYPLLVPISYRPDNTRPFGHSRISRTMIAAQDMAARTFLDASVASGAAAFPQKYITGLAEDVEISPNWETAVSKIWAFYKDENGDSPNLGQFPQIQLSPYSEHMRMCAAVFAGHADLTMDDLGFVSSNPSSYDAMRTAHENLRLRARKFQKTAEIGFKNAGYLAACLRDETAYTRYAFRALKAVWEPIFTPDPTAIAAIADGIVKLNTASDGFASKKTISELTGIPSEE